MKSEYYNLKNYESFYYFTSLFVLRDGIDFLIFAKTNKVTLHTISFLINLHKMTAQIV